MNPALLEDERKRHAYVLRVMPLLGAGAPLLALGTALKALRLSQVSASHGMSFHDAWSLLWMPNSERLSRSFAGYEVVLMGYDMSIVWYASFFVLYCLALVSIALAWRRRNALLNHLEALERRLAEAAAPDRGEAGALRDPPG